MNFSVVNPKVDIRIKQTHNLPYQNSRIALLPVQKEHLYMESWIFKITPSSTTLSLTSAKWAIE
jgi:hypothetical protein